jgi:predicted unusual protein kinase regulating ubiquinone biosynthesis (AarF/ABC1/UbiB family)
MSEKRPSSKVSRIKTSRIERRMALATAGMVAGARLARESAFNLFATESTRRRRQVKVLGEQARFLVAELGKLKGSVVKIGQMMALYGEHFLPEEVTRALHTLEDQTVAMSWDAISPVLQAELGKQKLAQLEIEPDPVAAASLGQVHRARLKSDGQQFSIKVQYPGIAEAIDSDLEAVASLLRLAKLVSRTREFEDWLGELRLLLHREVDYRAEAEATERFRRRLMNDRRFVVPRVFPQYSTARVLTTSWENGFAVNSADVATLPQERRNGIAAAARDLLLAELMEWGELQTDPNFGNYRVRPARDRRAADKLVLLDFGAVRQYSDPFLAALREIIIGAYRQNHEQIIRGAINIGFMDAAMPKRELNSFARLCVELLEPLASDFEGRSKAVLNQEGAYCWKDSDLPRRIVKKARNSAFSHHFSVPPKEIIFINRKLVGVYTMLAVLAAELDSRDCLGRYR